MQLVCNMVDFYFVSWSDLFLNIVGLHVMQADPCNIKTCIIRLNARIKEYMYTVYMEVRFQNLTICIVIGVYITWEEQF
jgi:hypothetical protein